MADSKDRPQTKIVKAVALRYRPEEEEAPKVAAKGRGRVAEKILELAREHGIPIKEDPDLVEVLSRLDIEEEIPPEVYVVVAEILAFVYKTNQAYRQRVDGAAAAKSDGPLDGRV